MAAIIVASLTNIYELRWQMRSFSFGEDRDMTGYLQRLDRVRKLIPGVQTVGYLSDVVVADMPVHPEEFKRYSLTKYTLVPVLVNEGTADDYVIGSFSSRATANNARQRFAIVVDFGDDLLLLRKKSE
jgi:hypothetical protein